MCERVRCGAVPLVDVRAGTMQSVVFTYNLEIAQSPFATTEQCIAEVRPVAPKPGLSEQDAPAVPDYASAMHTGDC
jgi:hypothetical protein